MNEYIEYIKWFAKNIYINKMELLGNIETSYIFHDDISNIYLANNLIIIIDCKSIEDAVYKIYKYKSKLEEKYKILDISLFKGNDVVEFSETYLISFYCVEIQEYNNNNQYNKVFNKEQKKTKKIFNLIDKIIEQNNLMNIEINNIPQNNENKCINGIFEKNIELILKNNKRKLNVLKSNRIKKGVYKLKYTNNNNKFIRNIQNNINIDYIEGILKKRKTLKTYKKTKNKYVCKKQNNIYDKIFNTSPYSLLVIIDCITDEDNLEYIEVFKSLNSKIVVISDNSALYNKEIIVIPTLKTAINILSGFKVLYASNKKNKIENDYIINIDLSKYKSANTSEVLDEILKIEDGIKLFANLEHKNSIKVLTSTFLSFKGDNYYSGGAERYLIDLHKVCEKLGFKLRIYQKADFNFFRYYNNIEVVGISSNNEQYNYEDRQNMNILNMYNCIAKAKTKLNIYSSFMECLGKAVSPSIGISHGVAWDHKKNKYNKSKIDNKNWIVESAIACNKLVSVDTNTANYFQTIDFKLGNTIQVIPNYVDIDEFTPKGSTDDNSNIVLLYPRRLYEARGLYLLLDIVDRLLLEKKDLEIHFVGKGFKEDESKIKIKQEKWGEKRIKIYNCPPEKMYEVYKKADISVIPTLYSEGTSLSCLEAMASENAVIATRVGGLTDLIINNYNGKLIEPNKESLYNAIIEFINNPELMNKCKKNAREISKEFNKQKWQQSWSSLIKEYANKKSNGENIYYKVSYIYVSDEKINSSKLKKLIYYKLIDNRLVYIINNNIDEKLSYGRLQYIKNDLNMYRKPEEILIDSQYKSKDKIEGKIIEI